MLQISIWDWVSWQLLTSLTADLTFVFEVSLSLLLEWANPRALLLGVDELTGLLRPSTVFLTSKVLLNGTPKLSLLTSILNKPCFYAAG